MTLIRILFGVLLGVQAFDRLGLQLDLLSLLFAFYALVEAGLYQWREQSWSGLPAFANLPVEDTRVFDGLMGDSLARSYVMLGFASGYLVRATMVQTDGLLLMTVLGLACAILLWAVSLASALVLVAALPNVGAAFFGVGAVLLWLATHGYPRLPAALPSGWAVEAFDGVVLGQASPWGQIGSILLVLLLGRINLSVLRQRYRVLESGWREVTAELVIDLLVREAADELVEAGVPAGISTGVPEGSSGGAPAGPSGGASTGVPAGSSGGVSEAPTGDSGTISAAGAGPGGVGRVPAPLRQRAARNVDAAVRAAVLRGAWRRPTRPVGTVERLLWAALSDEQREVAAFVAPMGRAITMQWRGALVVAALTALAAALEMSLFVQGFGIVAVAWLCLSPLGGRGLDPAVSEGALPIDVMGLLWIALQIAALRVALWIPLLLLQAAMLGHFYGEPNAPVIALRAAILILTLQPFLVALMVAGVDHRVGESSFGHSTALSGLVVPVVLVTLIGATMIAGEPPFAEAPLDALAAVLSLVIFLLHGTSIRSR